MTRIQSDEIAARRTPPPRPNGRHTADVDAGRQRVARLSRAARADHRRPAAPGARIAERAVVGRTGLSRTPVRSALHRLQQEGLVASVGRAGDQRLIVTPLTRGDGREVFLIVGHLEGLAAREAASLARRPRKRLVVELREVNRTLARRRAPRPRRRACSTSTCAFHETYVEGVAGPRVVALHRAIKPQSERYARLYVNVLLDELPTSVKEHDVDRRGDREGRSARRAARRRDQLAQRRRPPVRRDRRVTASAASGICGTPAPTRGRSRSPTARSPATSRRFTRYTTEPRTARRSLVSRQHRTNR